MRGATLFGNMVIDFDRLPPDVRDYVNAKVKEGAYPSIEVMLADAVRRTRREKEELHARLAAAEASLARVARAGLSPSKACGSSPRT